METKRRKTRPMVRVKESQNNDNSSSIASEELQNNSGREKRLLHSPKEQVVRQDDEPVIPHEEYGYVLEELKRKNRGLCGSLTLGKQRGTGSFATVYSVDGASQPLVLKVVDTRVIKEEGQTPALKLKYARQEIQLMKRVQSDGTAEGQDHVMELICHIEIPIDSKNNHYIVAMLMPQKTPLIDYMEAHADAIDNNFLRKMMVDLCKAQMWCEKNRVLHRDIKDGNIFIEFEEDGTPHFILGDFGVARSGAAPNDPEVKKRPHHTKFYKEYYVAPEMVNGAKLNGFTTDLYAIGMNYRYFAGPYDESKDDGFHYPATFCAVDPKLMKIAMKASAEEPKKRYQSAREMLADLDKLLPVEKVKREPVPKREVNYAEQCKKALLKLDLDSAGQYAKEGMKKGDRVCTRIYVYQQYINACAVAKRERMYSHSVTKIPFGREQIEPIKNDPEAQWFYAFILIVCCQDPEGGRLLKEAAQADSEAALYRYGVFALHGGMPGVELDVKAGLEALEKAAMAGYLPALQYLKMPHPKRENAVNDYLDEHPSLYRQVKKHSEAELRKVNIRNEEIKKLANPS